MKIKYILLSVVLFLGMSACDKQADAQPSTAEKPAVLEQASPAAEQATAEAVEEAAKPAVQQEQTVAAKGQSPDAQQAVSQAEEKAKALEQKSSQPANTPMAKYQQGVHYKRLPQDVPVATTGKLEVAEVFWYGCIHCYRFEPFVKGWRKTMPVDVAFVHVPAVWNSRLELHARAYYTAKFLKVLDKVHMPIFVAMNEHKNQLSSQKDIEAIFTANGVDAEDFNSMFYSFGVSSKVTMAKSLAQSYGVEGTPEVVVNGKYRVTSQMAGGYEKIFDVVNYLLDKERK